MKPVPTRQRRRAHRQRLALGRALHQVRRMRMHVPTYINIQIPKIVRKHAVRLRYVFRILGA